MDLSRKDFLRRAATGAVGATFAASSLSRLLGQPASPTNAAPAAGEQIIDGEVVRPAIALANGGKGVEVSEGGAVFANHGPGFGRRIAITFDDGPHPKLTPRVLEILKERNIYSTFFQIGQNVSHFPEVSAQVLAAGHELGNHSLTHPQMNKLSPERAAYEIQRTQDLIGEATGFAPVWFRPPYGAFSKKTQGELASSRGLGVMYWSVDPDDWKEPGADVIVQRIVSQTVPGSIILCHDIHGQTVDALPRILDSLLERGFEFTTVSGFMGAPYGVPGALPSGVSPAAPLPPGVPAGEPTVKDPAPKAASA